MFNSRHFSSKLSFKVSFSWFLIRSKRARDAIHTTGVWAKERLELGYEGICQFKGCFYTHTKKILNTVLRLPFEHLLLFFNSATMYLWLITLATVSTAVASVRLYNCFLTRCFREKNIVILFYCFPKIYLFFLVNLYEIKSIEERE